MSSFSVDFLECFLLIYAWYWLFFSLSTNSLVSCVPSEEEDDDEEDEDDSSSVVGS